MTRPIPSLDAPADVAVIGGGAAGLLAGIAASRAGARTVVYERNAAPGRKVALAGGGRCNLSNTLTPPDFLRRFGDPRAARLGHALRAFSRDDLLGVLRKHGVEARVEQGFRLFTRSGRGADVAKALCDELREAGAALVPEALVTVLRRDDDGFVLEGRFAGREGQRGAKAVVVCTGGLSYPETGSTGDGFAWARALGHTVTPLRPGLVGLTVAEEWPKALSGTACADVSVCLWPLAPPSDQEGAKASVPSPPVGEVGAPSARRVRDDSSGSARRPLDEARGEVLFTHFGLSGPAILDLSNAYVRTGIERARLRLDFFPDLAPDELDRQLCGCLSANPRKGLARALAGSLPGKLLGALIAGSVGQTFLSAGPDGADRNVRPATALCANLPAGKVSKALRRQLVAALKATALTVTGTREVRHAEVTVGGVSWDEVDAATLQSRLVPGLFFAGEVLDVAGRCGGFNLQAAFSTGFLAGRSAARFRPARA